MANIFGREITKQDFLRRVGNTSQVAYIRPYEMRDAKSNGLKAIDVVTGGGLEFTLLEGKCLDIAGMRYKGTNFSFISKPGLVASEFFNPYGEEFLRNYQGGMLYTCGLSNVGLACMDEGKEYGIHGRIAHVPAGNVRIISEWDGDEYVLEVAGEMREASLFNENLVLKRVVSTKMGAKFLRIHDEVENQGFNEQLVMILYHCNFGYPILDDATRLVLPDIDVIPRDEEAAKGIKDYASFCAPIDNYKEQVFYHKVAYDRDGNTFVGVINDRLKLGAYIKYNTHELPRLIQWKSMKSGDYALGVEPANCFVEGRHKERQRGTLRTLSSFEKAVFDLEIGILDGLGEINEFEALVKSLSK